jgi:hypothetical protein
MRIRNDVRSFRTHAVDNAPLNQRAWVSQERLLSVRVMHFTSAQIFWECQESNTSEHYPLGLPSWALPPWYNDPTQLKHYFRKVSLHGTSHQSAFETLSVEHPTEDDPYYHWGSFRMHYTTCGLTKDKDKLVALRGIADTFGGVIKDRLVAGLWTNRLPQELCWHKVLHGRSAAELSSCRAPTWSWASSNAIIWMSIVTMRHRHHKGLTTWIDIVDIDVVEAPSGELLSASMRLNCKIIPALVCFSGRSTGYHKPISHLILEARIEKLYAGSPGHAAVDIEFIMDDIDQPETRHVYLMVVQSCQHRADHCEKPEEIYTDTANDKKSFRNLHTTDQIHLDNRVAEQSVSEDKVIVGDAEKDSSQHELFGRVICVEGLVLLPQSSSSDPFINWTFYHWWRGKYEEIVVRAYFFG